MARPPQLSDPNRARRSALMLFYAGAVICGAAAAVAQMMLRHGARAGIGFFALAALAALMAIAGLIRVLQTADELQRRINHQALAFAYVGTLIVCLVCGFLQQLGLPCLSGLGVCALLVALWSLGLILSSRRYQ
jgi:hypothetical protein